MAPATASTNRAADMPMMTMSNDTSASTNYRCFWKPNHGVHSRKLSSSISNTTLVGAQFSRLLKLPRRISLPSVSHLQLQRCTQETGVRGSRRIKGASDSKWPMNKGNNVVRNRSKSCFLSNHKHPETITVQQLYCTAFLSNINVEANKHYPGSFDRGNMLTSSSAYGASRRHR